MLWFGRREAAVGQLRGSLLPRRGRAKLQLRCNGIHQELGPVRIEVGRIEEEGIAAVWSTHQATLMLGTRAGGDSLKFAFHSVAATKYLPVIVFELLAGSVPPIVKARRPHPAPGRQGKRLARLRFSRP